MLVIYLKLCFVGHAELISSAYNAEAPHFFCFMFGALSNTETYRSFEIYTTDHDFVGCDNNIVFDLGYNGTECANTRFSCKCLSAEAYFQNVLAGHDNCIEFP